MTDRTAYIAAFALFGAAIALLTYQVAVAGGDDYWFIGGAVGMAYAGRQSIRNRERPNLLAPLGAGVAGAAIALGIAYAIVPPLGNSRLATRELPGFALGLPAGEIKTDDTGDYMSGKLLETKNDATTVIQVGWARGSAFSPDDLKALGVAVAAGFGPSAGEPKVQAIDGVPTVQLDIDKGVLRLSIEPCGVRYVMIGTMGRGGVEQLHRRIVATFQCHPDPAKEQATAALPFPMTFDLPGWWASSRDNGQLQLTDGKRLVVLQATSSSDTDLAQFLGKALAAENVEVHALGDGRASLLVKAGSDAVPGFSRLIHCGRGDGLIIGLGPASDLAALNKIVDAGKCLEPGEAAQTFKDGPAR